MAYRWSDSQAEREKKIPAWNIPSWRNLQTQDGAQLDRQSCMDDTSTCRSVVRVDGENDHKKQELKVTAPLRRRRSYGVILDDDVSVS